MSLPKTGLVIGEFMPFHQGHNALIAWAKTHVQHLIVIVGYKVDHAISGETRAAWIRTEHPEVEVILTPDDLPFETVPWARRTLEILQGRSVDLVFSSEDYGDYYGLLIGAKHLMFDQNRQLHPISGTYLRQDMKRHWQMLSPPARAYFAKRVAIVGVDSSGKTTLSRALAKHFHTCGPQEYGRLYWEGRQYAPSHTWTTPEFWHIAAMQGQMEDMLARESRWLVIADTDALATHVWHRRYIGVYDPMLEEMAMQRDYDLYLLCEPDFEFVQDGTRMEDEEARIQMHRWFKEELEKQNRNYICVYGDRFNRLHQSIEAIEPLLHFPSFSR